MTFDQAIVFVLQQEGGYVWDKDDKGGETNFGITKRRYPNLDIKRLTKDDAISIYKRDFWNKYRIESLPEKLQLQVFDMTVNSGNSAAIKTLQRALNAIDPNYALTVDGLIGQLTFKAAAQVMNDMHCEQQLILMYGIERIIYCSELAVNDHTQIKFLRTWMRRAKECTLKSK